MHYRVTNTWVSSPYNAATEYDQTPRSFARPNLPESITTIYTPCFQAITLLDSRKSEPHALAQGPLKTCRTSSSLELHCSLPCHR